MNARLAAAAVVIGIAAFLFLRRGRSPAHAQSATTLPTQEVGHAVQIDHAMAAILALEHAPEGGTPCESAYNAYKASKDVSDSQGVKAVVHFLAPRDEFLARCAELPAGAQACLVPRYLTRHRDECSRNRANPATLTGMVDLLQRAAPVDDSEPLPVQPAAPSAAGP